MADTSIRPPWAIELTEQLNRKVDRIQLGLEESKTVARDITSNIQLTRTSIERTIDTKISGLQAAFKDDIDKLRESTGKMSEKLAATDTVSNFNKTLAIAAFGLLLSGGALGAIYNNFQLRSLDTAVGALSNNAEIAEKSLEKIGNRLDATTDELARVATNAGSLDRSITATTIGISDIARDVKSLDRLVSKLDPESLNAQFESARAQQQSLANAIKDATDLAKSTKDLAQRASEGVLTNGEGLASLNTTVQLLSEAKVTHLGVYVVLSERQIDTADKSMGLSKSYLFKLNFADMDVLKENVLSVQTRLIGTTYSGVVLSGTVTTEGFLQIRVVFPDLSIKSQFEKLA